MTRANVELDRSLRIKQAVFLGLIAFFGWGVYFIFQIENYRAQVLFFMLLIVVGAFVEALWRFAHPYIPDREGWIWKTGWVHWAVDDMLATVAKMRNGIIMMSFFMTGLQGAFLIWAVMRLWDGHTISGALLIIVMCVIWVARHVMTTLLPKQDQ